MQITSAIIYNFIKTGTQQINIFYEDGSDQWVPNDVDNSDYQQFTSWASDNQDNIFTLNIDQ